MLGLMQFVPRVKAWFVLLLFGLLVECSQLAAQISQKVNNQDSESESGSVDAALIYEIQALKLEMIWSDLSLHDNFADLIELKQFAQEAAASGDYDLALIYVSELFAAVDEARDTTSSDNTGSLLIDTSKLATRSFTKAVNIGMDFSEQQYNLTFGASDSTFLESLNNPFTGVSLRWKQFLPNHHEIEFGGKVKYSRDYTIWEALSSFSRSNLAGWVLQFDQRWDGLDYQRSYPIQYWQSTSNIQINKDLGKYVDFSFGDEFQYRNHRNETESFPTYWRNEFQAALRLGNFWKSRFSLGYDVDRRRQRTFTTYDYLDQRVDFQHSLLGVGKTSIMTWYQFREMDYTQVSSDSTFLADFQQHYASLNLRQNIFKNITLKFVGEAIIRDYPLPALFTPDFLFFRLEPGFSFDFSRQLSMGVHYIRETKEFNKTDTQETDFFLNENLSSQGITVSVDYFNYRNLLFTISHTFRLESYPDAPDNPIPGFSLYTDRAENSTLMYISYQMLSRFEITVVMQHDLNRDREIENNDSRSSIFSLDLNWEF